MTLSAATPFFASHSPTSKFAQHGGPGSLGDRDRVAQVIAVAVREQDEVGLHAVGFDRAVGESFKNGSTRTVLPAVSIDQALWPNQVIVVAMVI